MKYLVYKVTFPNNKIYIGITSKGLEFRKKKHYKTMKTSSTKFYSALKKYQGQEIWEEFMYSFTWNDCRELEKQLIAYFNTFKIGYNSTLGGEGISGHQHKKETKLKISHSNTAEKSSQYGKKYSNFEAEKIAISMGAKPFKVLLNNEVLGIWISKSECARSLKLSRTKISSCLNQPEIYKSHKRYIFKYVGEQNGIEI